MHFNLFPAPCGLKTALKPALKHLLRHTPGLRPGTDALERGVRQNERSQNICQWCKIKHIILSKSGDMTENTVPENNMSPEIREFIESKNRLRADPQAWEENVRRWRHLHAKMQSSIDDSLEPSLPPDDGAERVEI